MADDPENHYVSFVEQVQRQDRWTAEGLLHLPPDGQDSNDEFIADLERILSDLPTPLRRFRIEQAQVFSADAALDRERAVTAGCATIAFDVFANELLDGIAGFLAAPTSDATARRLGGSGAMVTTARSIL